MINRISIKGRGDDVFFPDEEAANKSASNEKSEVRASQQADSSATMPASEPASMQASYQACQQTSLLADRMENKNALLRGSQHVC